MTETGGCARPGCPGLVEDGYCNTCGMAPLASAGPPAAAPPTGATPTGATSASSGSPATASGPAASGRAVSGGAVSGGAVSGGTVSGATASRRGRTTRSTGTRGNLGAGLIKVPPVPYRDPSSVVLAEPELPEHKRYCGGCGQPVGRTRGDKPGRSTGFCPHCGKSFSFTAKLHRGEVVSGQYEVVGPIAYGGLGWIYLARDRNVSERWVVLKGLLDSGDPSAMAAAFAERRFLARVEHPNIVRIYNFVTHDDAGYIVMEYVGGASLKDLRRGKPLPLTQAIAYILEILPALGYLHGQGLLYCDFKPDNVIQNEEQLKLIDLGGVRSIDDDHSDLYGTVGYQAPEVPDSGASIASDLYTVARTLAVMSFDFRGFQDPDRFATALPPASDVPLLARYDAFDRFLRRGAHPDPDSRFASAAEMAEQLLGVLRQVMAADGERPDPAPSRVFTAELLDDPSSPSWRDLPVPVVDAGDDAAGLLAGLAAAPPEQLIGVLAAVPPTPETRFQLARAHIERGEPDDAAQLLTDSEALDPGDWRVAWWRGVLALALARPPVALECFRQVADELPGELAPLLALAMALEAAAMALELGPDAAGLASAAALYGRVVVTDPSYAGAAFGLGRVRAALGDRRGAADALASVPSWSSFHRSAQETRCRVLVAAAGGATPDDDDLGAASKALDGLSTDAATRLELTRALLVVTLDRVVGDRATPLRPALPSGVGPGETSIRAALERTCRSLARLADSEGERIALVDEANTYRPRTLV